MTVILAEESVTHLSASRSISYVSLTNTTCSKRASRRTVELTSIGEVRGAVLRAPHVVHEQLAWIHCVLTTVLEMKVASPIRCALHFSQAVLVLSHVQAAQMYAIWSKPLLCRMWPGVDRGVPEVLHSAHQL